MVAQPTFLVLSRTYQAAQTSEKPKVFCFFSSEKKTLLPLLRPCAAWRPRQHRKKSFGGRRHRELYCQGDNAAAESGALTCAKTDERRAQDLSDVRHFPELGS